VYPPLSLLGNGSVNPFSRQRIHATVEELLDSFLCGPCRVKGEFVGLYPLSLQGNGYVNTFPWQRRTIGGVVLYAVHVISKESKRLVLPRNSRLLLRSIKINSFCFITKNPFPACHLAFIIIIIIIIVVF
jgi:hypothetical protein